MRLGVVLVVLAMLAGCSDSEGSSEGTSEAGTGAGGSGAATSTGGNGGEGASSGGSGGSGGGFSNAWSVDIGDADGSVQAGDMAALFDGETIFSEMTMSLWVSVDSTPSSGDGMLAVGDEAVATLQLYWSESSGPITAAFGPNTMTLAHAEIPNGDYASWHHIAGVYGNNTASIYLDGALVDEVSAGQPSLNVGGIIYMGRFYSGPDLRLDGRLDEVAIYTRALMAGEVAAIAAAGRNTDVSETVSDGIAAYFRMGDDVGGMGMTMTDRVRSIEAQLLGAATFADAN